MGLVPSLGPEENSILPVHCVLKDTAKRQPSTNQEACSQQTLYVLVP